MVNARPFLQLLLVRLRRLRRDDAAQPQFFFETPLLPLLPNMSVSVLLLRRPWQDLHVGEEVLVFRRVVEVVDRDCVGQFGMLLASSGVNHSPEFLQQLQPTSVLKEPKVKKITLSANGLQDQWDLQHHVEVGDVPLNLTDNLE